MLTRNALLYCDGCDEHLQPHTFVGFQEARPTELDPRPKLKALDLIYRCACGETRPWGNVLVSELSLADRAGIERNTAIEPYQKGDAAKFIGCAPGLIVETDTEETL